MSIVFYFGHKKLPIFRFHGFKVLNSMFVVLASSYHFHHYEIIVLIALLYASLSFFVLKINYYDTLSSTSLIASKNLIFSLGISVISLLIIALFYKFSGFTHIVSLAIIPFYLAILFSLYYEFVKTKKLSDLNNLTTLSWTYEVLFFSFLYYTILSGTLEKLLFVVCVLSSFHLT